MSCFIHSSELGTSSSQPMLPYVDDRKNYFLSKMKQLYLHFSAPLQSQSVGDLGSLLNS